MKFFLLLSTLGFLGLGFFGSSARAIDSSQCSTMMNNGLYKTYKWRGVGESNTKAITAETKSSNIVSATSKMTTEGTTASVDPKYSSNVSTSQTQSTSSWGPCSAFALQERTEQREIYVAQNLEQIKKDVANGQGRHLEVLAWFSLCDASARGDFNQALQKNMPAFVGADSKAFNKTIDGVIRTNGDLSNKCYALTAN